jgi:hypothetical protein
MKSFIVEFWSKIFSGLGKISLFWAIRFVARKKFPATSKIRRFIESYGFVEVWASAQFILSIVLLLICWSLNLRWGQAIATGAVIYGGIQVFTVVIYQINVLLFDWYRARKEELKNKREGVTYTPYALRSYRRSVVLIMQNYVEIIFWFALFYRSLSWAFNSGRDSLASLLDALNFSFFTMTTFGYTTITSKGTLGDILTLVQSAIGLVMALLVLASFISWLPKPKTLDEFER